MKLSLRKIAVPGLFALLTGGTRRGALPARLRIAIQEQQERSEVLISIIQLLVVTVFALLYAVAPKTFTEEAGFAPVPWVLALYFGFSLLRLTLAVRRALPDWMLYLSSVIDVVLLVGLIWSFHLQYEQPPSFYLKAPTMLYLFIFIAIRALHFDPRFVISTGIAAAAGWASLVGFVMLSDAAANPITRNYVEYMTSNSVLIGAEFDKILSILMVTGVLALAQLRARELLVEAVVEGSAARDLSVFVPEEVARQVVRSEEGAITGRGEVRECTIMFTDIEGFTELSESMSPELLIEALNRYFALISEPISRRGGVINQYQGDAVLASFNIPRPDEDHAANALRAALDLQAALDREDFGGGVSFRTRIGLNTGRVVGGLVGSPNRLGYTIHGRNVNLAARLEQMNKRFGTRVLLAESTRRRVNDDSFHFRDLGQVPVSGFRDEVGIYTVASANSSSKLAPVAG